MNKLSQRNTTELALLFLDRLAFARVNVELYASLSTSVERSSDPRAMRALGDLQRCVAQEIEHATWLEAKLRDLGTAAGAGSTRTPRPATVWTEAVRHVARGATIDVERESEALFAAELLDHAGWHTLLQLADEVDDEQSKQALRKRLLEKDDHLHILRQIIYAAARRRLLGAAVRAAA